MLHHFVPQGARIRQLLDRDPIGRRLAQNLRLEGHLVLVALKFYLVSRSAILLIALQLLPVESRGDLLAAGFALSRRTTFLIATLIRHEGPRGVKVQLGNVGCLLLGLPREHTISVEP